MAAEDRDAGESTASSNPSGPVCPLNSRPSVTVTITHAASVSPAQARRESPSNGLPHRTPMAISPRPRLAWRRGTRGYPNPKLLAELDAKGDAEGLVA